jgi:hypothetical protein
MLRHNHIPNQPKSMSHTDGMKNPDETIPAVRASQERAPMKTTKRYEMKIALAVTSFQRIAHGRKPTPLKVTRVWHPSHLPIKISVTHIQAFTAEIYFELFDRDVVAGAYPRGRQRRSPLAFPLIRRMPRRGSGFWRDPRRRARPRSFQSSGENPALEKSQGRRSRKFKSRAAPLAQRSVTRRLKKGAPPPDYSFVSSFKYA